MTTSVGFMMLAEVNNALQRKIAAGERFDVAVLNPPVLDELIRQGMIAADTRAVIGRIGVVVVASRIFGVPGVELAGLIPSELQTMIGFAAGVGSAAREPDAARMLVQFLTAPAAAPLLKAMGIEPFVE